MEKDVQHDKSVSIMNENLPTVLVVEDDVGLNHLIRKTLERGGIKSHQALNGAEAMAAAAALQYSLILLDYCLPDMTGKQIILALSKKEIHTPIIVITGNGDERIAVEVMKLGVRDYIIKEPDFISKLPRNIHRVIEVVEKEKELSQAGDRQTLTLEVLELLNRAGDTTGTISDILKLIKKRAGFEAVGIRLQNGDDFPYYETNGFPAHFVESERYLCASDGKGNIIRDGDGAPVLECMCGDIIRGRTDPTKPFFTSGGSFWSNSTTELLSCTTEEDRRTRMRNRCSGEGFESVALIPLREGENIIGLLQFNDRRKDRFTLEIIRFFEGLGAVIGIALSRKKGEEKLIESKALFEAVVENVPLMIFLKEAKDLRFLIFNRAGEDLLGYDRTALLGKNNLDLFAPEQASHFMAKDREVLDGESGMLDIPEEPIDTAKNGRRLLHTRKVCIRGKDGTTKYLLGISEDITERKLAEEKQKRLEEQLRQSQKLESIGQLSSGVAHDFNNLLGGIMGHAELLKMGLDPNSPLMRHPDTIISSCLKAADLTRQLLMFARKAPVEFQKVELNNFIKQVVKLIRRTIDHSIEIAVDLQERPVIILADRNQLENALLNITINARDAMPEGGRLQITIETTDLKENVLIDEHFEVAESGPYARISIKDTGTGMSKETRDRIFEPFFTTKEVGKGTGLGLASVYGCVKQHNGYITVASQEGKGTTFSIYLPEAESAGPATGAQAEITLVPGIGSLLVVDDEPVYHEIVNKIFGSLGYTVHCCANGPDAIAFYREHASTIDLVILDMNMPKMNGLQCFRELKEINHGVKVIVTSGYGDNSDRQAMLKEGACTFVQKPYKAVDLAKEIKELMAA